MSTAAITRPPSPIQRPAEVMPPFALPAAHFAAGLLWLALGAVGLLLVAPDLARGAFLAPRVIAVTHCFTLGWITMSIFGALYQLYPVVLGVAARSVNVGHITFWILFTGVSLIVVGSWFWLPALIAAGWVALCAAVGSQAWNVLGQRRQAHRGKIIGIYVSAGHMSLGLAMLVVAARIAAEFGWWQVDRLRVLNLHAHLAVVGFATLTAVGISSKLFPMFLLSRNYRDWPLRWIGPLTFGGLLVFGSGQLTSLDSLTWAGGLATAGGIGLYLWLAAGYFRCRTRKRLEPGLAHAAGALVFLGLATAMGVALLLTPSPAARVLIAYAVVGILGWLTLLIVGMYYKIVPFLTWLHRFSPRVGEPGLPKVSDLVKAELAWVTLVLFTCGVALLALGVALGRETVALLGAALFAAGTSLVVGQSLRLARTR